MIAPMPISTIENEKLAILEQFEQSWDPNLRSTKDVSGLCVEDPVGGGGSDQSGYSDSK